MIQSAQSNTTLRPPWLNIARAAWVGMSVIALVAMIVGVAIMTREQLPTCTTPQASCAPWSVSQEDLVLAQQSGLPHELMLFAVYANLVLPKIFIYAVGLIIFWRKSDDWVALLLSLMLTLFTTEGVTNLGVLMPLINFLYIVATVAYYLLPFIFPTGRFEPRWTRWIFPPLLIVALAVQAITLLAIPVDDSIYGLALMAAFLPWFLLAGYAVIYRYTRIANSTERQQIKWVMAGILGTFIIIVPFTIISLVFPPSQPSLGRLAFYFLVSGPIGILSYLFLAGGIGFAILRYRLYDIDIIIRRTLIYSTITATLALFYFGAVIILQQLFRALTGAGDDLAIIVSTLAIAALFNPLRNRVQNSIDHRFYRRKYDAQKVLERFAATVRDEVELEKLTGELLNVVSETMQPTHVSLWLNDTAKTSRGTNR